MLWSMFTTLLAFLPLIFAQPFSHGRHHGGFHQHAHFHRRTARQNSYSVVSGDTGSAIATAYSISFSTLSSANPNVNWDSLQIGQTLKMPSSRIPFTYTIMGGDKPGAISAKYNIYNVDLANANPKVNWSKLVAGVKIRIPGYGSYTTYSVTSGDTGYVIAQTFGISFDAFSAANPNVNWSNLQIGQVLTVPAGVSPTTGSIPSPATPPSTTKTTTMMTTTTLSTTLRTTTAAVTTSTSSRQITQISITTRTTSSSSSSSTISTTATPPNATDEPVVTPTATVIGANYVKGGNDNEGVSSRADAYTFYQGDGSAGMSWPDRSQWISFATMWKNISPVLGQSCVQIHQVANNSPQENQYIYNAIKAVAMNSGVDARLILATIIQESSGCVRVKTTISADKTVSNPGLMQDFNGSGSCNQNGQVLNPCPASQIYQMIQDGVFGTRSNGASTYQTGLVQDINGNGGYTGSQAYYRASRMYNSGSIPSTNDMGAPGATRCYVSDVANRLMGWMNAARTCTLDG